MISRNTFGICAGVAGALFVGYCVYFDKKRRNDPNFKRKLRERRSRQGGKTGGSSRKYPNMSDPAAVQAFFFSEIQTGEKLLSEGDVAGGIERIAIAVTVCNQPEQLLQVLQQTLPPQVFSLLIQALPIVGAKMKAEADKQKSSKVLKISEEDVE